MTQIIRAQHMGFCFGVRDALTAAGEVDRPDQTTIYGELVHNADVIATLQKRQFELLAETNREMIPERPSVMVTAHGISEKRRERLVASGKQLIDTTCPLVRRVHDTAMKLAERDHFVVVIGNKQHVEVLGVVEDLPMGRWAVVASPSDARLYHGKKIGIVSQSTMPEDVAGDCRDRIAELNPQASVRWVNTICRPTKQRQSAVDQLCQQVDVVVVVGGVNSNNTRRLVERCESQGRPAHLVQSADDVRGEWFVEREKIGLTAGTSTPDESIDAVEVRISKLVGDQPSYDPVSRPNRLRCQSWSNSHWVKYFQHNLADEPHIPWSNEATLTPQEHAALTKSIQTFQLGESGEGKHIKACATAWIQLGGDAGYLTALTLFLREEHRHSSMLGQFLAQEGQPLLERQWSDNCFRFLRHLAGLRTSISVLVTAEILAQVYYLALFRATDSPSLRTICKRVMRDECAHVLFQQNQSNLLARHWGRVRRWWVNVAEDALFAIAMRIVWHDHRSVFVLAKMNWHEYRDRCYRRWIAVRA